MADYEFKYRLASAPKVTSDGSGCVKHDMWLIAREVGSEDPFAPRSGLPHKDIAVPASELLVVLQGSGIPAKYKQALVNNLNTIPVSVRGWDIATAELTMDNNDLSIAAATAADEWITITAGLTYPVDFVI